MTSFDSVTPDITESIPTPLSRVQQASQNFAQTGLQYDVAIAGIPFLMAPNTAGYQVNAYIRETAPYQKQQIDTTREAGEQTLDGYWIRSQTTWDKGAGIRFYEPTLDQDSADRFESSLGVDVWTKGKVSLLKSCSNIAAVSSAQDAYVVGGIVGGADVIFTNENGVVKRRDASGALLQTYTGITTAAGKVRLAGSKIVAVESTFSIKAADASGSAFTTIYTQALNTSPQVWWAKSRLIASRKNQLVELALDGSTAGGNLDTALNTPLYTHPDTNWNWSSVAEGPAAIYAAGYNNGLSYIYAFSLQDATSGSVPVLSQAYQVGELPLGEEIRSIHAAFGSFLGIGTSKGFRVAVIESNGALTIGPLLFNSTNPVTGVTSGDRFFYGVVQAGHPDGNSGAFRVDLSQMIGNNTLRFPYAWDARTGSTGAPSSVALVGASGRVAMGVTGVGIFMQSATAYETTGYFTSGRIRYGTVVPKNFQLLSVNETSGHGTVVLSSLDPQGSETTLRTLQSGTDGDKISLATLPSSEFFRFKVTLQPEGTTVTPVIESIQVRALPTPLRQRLIQYPLLCMDFQQAANGVKFGHEGYAAERLQALEYAEENNVVLSFQDFSLNETFQGTIEKISFRRPGPRSSDARANFGGFLSVTVRKL